MPRSRSSDPESVTSRPGRFSWWNFALPAALALLVLGWFAVVSLRPAYHKFRASGYAQRAERLITSGELKSADLQISNALRHDPANVDAWRLYARLLRAQGDPRHAIAEAQLWELVPDHEDQAARALAACLETGSRDLGLYLATQMTPRFPRNASIQHNAAILFTQARRLPEAARALEAAAAAAPQDPLIQVSRAALDLASPDTNLAATAAARLRDLSANPDLFPSAASSLAYYLDDTNPAAAETIREEIVRRQPAQWDNQMRLLQLKHRRDPNGTPLRTEGLWTLATNLPQRLDLVTAALQSAGPEIALTVLDRIPGDERLTPMCRLVQLEVFGRMKDWQQVLDLAVAPLGNHPLDTEQQLLLPLWQIRASTALGRDDEAASATDRALSLAENNPRLACRAGMKLYEWQLAAPAQRLFEQCIRGNDTPAREAALRHLIALAEHRRDARAGLGFAERLLETQPAEIFARQADAWFLLITQGNPRRAQAMVADLERQFPGTTGLGELSALARYRAGDLNAALGFWAPIPASAYRQPDSRVFLADALVQVGRPQEAVPVLAGIDPARLYPETRPLLEKLRTQLAPAR